MTTTTTNFTPAQKRAATLKYKAEVQAQAAHEARTLKAAQDAAELSAFLAENETAIADTAIVMTDALLAGVDVIFSTMDFKHKWARVEARCSEYDFGFFVADRIVNNVSVDVILSGYGYDKQNTVPTAQINWSCSGTQSLSATGDFASMLTAFAVLGSKLEEVLAPVNQVIAQDYRLVAEACNRTSAVVRPKVKAMMDDVRARIGE